MRLTTALDEYKRRRSQRFPEELRTTDGSFSGHGDRLVHVATDGSLRDYSSSLSGLYGIDRSRLGIRTNGETRWFTDLETIRQHYYRETRLVETEFDAGGFTVHQYDLTLGRAHVTHVELRGAVPAEASLVAFLTLAPEGKEAGVGALVHDDAGPDGTRALEVFHRREHDYVGASTGLDGVYGQRPERFTEILADDPVSMPRGDGRRDQTRLSGDFVVTAPLEARGRKHSTTLVNQLSDHDDVDRGTALADLRRCAREHDVADALREAARERTVTDVPPSSPRSSLVRTDLRVIDLLEAPSGGHIAGPEFDPFYANSGGYGYVWFRDDAELSRHLLAASEYLDVDPTDTLERAALFHCEAQLLDGTWPHRVWATDGSLAPGWANANVEHDEESEEYQADQTAAVTASLATLLRERRGDLSDGATVAIRETLVEAVDALLRDIAENGLPGSCQNLWEDAVGQFTHTAAAYLQAFAAVGRAPVRKPLRERALAGAETVLDALDTFWDETQGAYVMRLVDGTLDRRLDAGTLALVGAMREYDAVEETTLDEERVDRLVDHVGAVLDTLFRNPRHSQVAGLVRYEGDRWRSDDQDAEKVWSVATAMGALAAAQIGRLLNERGEGGEAEAYVRRAGRLYELLDEDGPLTSEAGYFAEQVFDDGTLDSATPLGWSHAVRLHLTALLHDMEALPAATTAIEGPTERPTWTTGEKYGVATAADHEASDPSRVWFTLTEGALTEARFPRVDVMNLRTLDFLVRAADDTGYTVRTHREDRSEGDTIERRVEPVADDALCFRHVFTETGDGRGHEWRLTVEYATDPAHDAIVADVAFESADDTEYDVLAVADTALANSGGTDRALRLGEEGHHHLVARDPSAYTGEHDQSLLVDENGEGYSVAVAMTAADRFDWATVDVAGGDRLRALFADGELPEARSSVDVENVVLIGRLGSGTRTEETVALGFARSADTAAALGEADGALDRGFESARADYVETWASFLDGATLPDSVADDDALANQYRFALMCLLAVADKTYSGASLASPSVPWGETVTADESKGYGYNFVWARDLYQVFSAFETVGALDVARHQLEYIYEYQQDETGFIPQNTYVNGITHWGGEQMDNISYPAVMAYHLAEHGIRFADAGYDYENLRRSADYVARNGPATAQERWEEESGYSPSSIAAEIAGLVCAATLAVEEGHEDDALVWFALADHWANNVDAWTATETGTERHEHTPYFVRITRDGDPEAGHLRTLANHGPTLDERDVIDAGFLELVRLGIYEPTEETLVNSIAEVDETIRVDADPAAAFYRYNGDGYGERSTADVGSPWTVEHSGKGRLWPLLTGERGEYELLGDAGLDPMDCLETLERFANSGRMISEQVWDRQHETDYDWEFGEGTGAATPLAWAMAQFVRLAHSIDAGEPVETPAVVEERYRERGVSEPDRSPALRVDSQFRGDSLVVFGETTGVRVAISTPVDRTIVDVEGGEFEATLDIEAGENQIIVAAAAARDLERAGTTVTQLRL